MATARQIIFLCDYCYDGLGYLGIYRPLIGLINKQIGFLYLNPVHSSLSPATRIEVEFHHCETAASTHVDAGDNRIFNLTNLLSASHTPDGLPFVG